MGKLADTFVSQVKHKGAAAGEKYSDGEGLYLLVKASGKYWRMAYRFAGKQKTLALGVYPAVSLAQVRKLVAKVRESLAVSFDLGMQKRIVKAALKRAAENTLEAVTREIHAK